MSRSPARLPVRYPIRGLLEHNELAVKGMDGSFVTFPTGTLGHDLRPNAWMNGFRRIVACVHDSVLAAQFAREDDGPREGILFPNGNDVAPWDITFDA